MVKEEFQDMIGQIISDQDYEIINTVYNFHPSVNEVSGKEEVAELYKSFGLAIFYDLLPRAERNCELERQLHRAQEKVEHIKQVMMELAHGSIPVGEDAVMEVQEEQGVKEMLKVIDDMLTQYLGDPHTTEACKKRRKLGMVRRIEEIYKNANQD
ncbi:MAG: hypothetical protein NC543_12080 [bacterium]|nr:hypothetical protein [bacterium]MCM1376100.1 hypothetical protein [Muribaculum sp.]